MSTLQDPSRLRQRVRTRSGAGLVTAGAPIAIAISILFLSLARTHRTPISRTAGAYSSITPSTVLSPSSTRVFRDPTTHALLRVRTARSGATEPRGGHNQGRILR
jgi:hypothetical protein